jgi:hypothetical protein
MKSKVISGLKEELGFPRTRGEVAVQEQIKIFRQAMAISKREPRAPTTGGEVAAQEQMRVFGLMFRTSGEPRAPQTRGEVAAQEQMRIIGQAAVNFAQNSKAAGAK